MFARRGSQSASQALNPGSKKILNDTRQCVDEAIEGLTFLNPNVNVLKTDLNCTQNRVVVRGDLEKVKGKVAIVCGGGSGHEPFSSGFVGEGLLSAAVAGPIFTAPPPSLIHAAIEHLNTFEPSGILAICLNYTGDRLVFGIALELAKRSGINVELFINGEDCANTGSKSVGKRGMAGSMLLLKIAGSMAEEGATLDDIKGKLEECAQQLGTIGVCLNPCTLPGQSDAMFPLSSAEIAFGLGVHGEAGIAMIPVASSSDLVEQMVDHMTDPANPSSVDLKEGSKVVVLINNLGSTSKTEELVFLRDVVKSLQSKGLDVIRTYSDRFMTSVDMAGVQMSVLVASDEILSHLDAPTSALAWPKDIWSSVTAPGFDLAKRTVVVEVSQEVEANEEGPKLSEAQSKLLKQILTSVVDDLIDSEDRINELDRGCGDGDCGTTLAIAAKAIKSSMDKYAFEYPLSLCLALARTIEQTAGGCGGGLYALFMMGAATAFEGVEAVTPEVWSTALEVGISRIKDYGGADVGDRTLLDALCPALSTWRSSDCGDIPALARGIREAATAGAASTKGAVAKVGRASYVSGPQLLVNPDPGATGAAVWIQTATREVEKSYFEDAAAVVL